MPSRKSAKSRVAIVDCGSSKVPDIARVVALCGAEPCVIGPQSLPAIAADLPAAIIISGNPTLIKDTGTSFLSDFEVLREFHVPVLGICFGHQVIGLLHGGVVSLGREDRDFRPMEILTANLLFQGLAEDDDFKQDHTEEVSLPEGFAHLATSSHCHNEAMMHPDRPLFGVQFHPESSGDAGEQLIRNFLSLV